MTSLPVRAMPVEIIQPDAGSSFKLLHHRVEAEHFRWEYHCHPELELVYVVGGVGRRHVGSHLSYYQDGDLVLIGSQLPHAGFGYGSKGIHEEIVIQFKEKAFLGIPEIQFIESLFEHARFGICFYGKTKEEVGAKMKRLPKLGTFERFLYMMEIFHMLAQSKEYILLNPQENTYHLSIKDHSRLKKLSEYLEQNFHLPIHIEEVASLVNLSVPAFCNHFKKMVGMRYTDFVNEYRIHKACQMLLSDKSMLDIGFECGFSSQSYFSKVFRKVKGRSPMQFRNEMINRSF
ncbi:transcriptional regulator, AraC family [Leadbetterella byssophila DSM 17132]|uniref:Transcriptional regulator, AraC family n=1 Tax=Leadbetterella byssophila (strain DSM 17132 / JCM 16389 / KACC 11308 / NBRC 106382 / 4M15) TaxID=649349 RepID=E4RWB7_LEAB4|nr:AraC family transcriptional regulator [Leadbetterella byssophila]ADQ17990.1 transcriptional regulator, AraC family [Leadbetterella byssophila DSM 17132]